MVTNKQPKEQTETPFDVGNTDFSRETFTAALNQTFTLQLDDKKSLPLKLVSLEESKHSNSKFDCFSLYFAPPQGELPLPDGSYRLANADLGEVFLHLSSKLSESCDPKDYEYEAVFNLAKT